MASDCIDDIEASTGDLLHIFLDVFCCVALYFSCIVEEVTVSALIFTAEGVASLVCGLP